MNECKISSYCRLTRLTSLNVLLAFFLFSLRVYFLSSIMILSWLVLIPVKKLSTHLKFKTWTMRNERHMHGVLNVYLLLYGHMLYRRQPRRQTLSLLFDVQLHLATALPVFSHWRKMWLMFVFYSWSIELNSFDINFFIFASAFSRHVYKVSFFVVNHSLDVEFKLHVLKEVYIPWLFVVKT